MWNLLMGSLSLALLLGSPAAARDLKLEAPLNSATIEIEMPAMAKAALQQYREPDERKRLDTLFRLQTAAGRWAEAERTLAALRARLAATGDPQERASDLQYVILVRARLLQLRGHVPFETAFTRAFHEIMDRLDDRASALVARALEADKFPVGLSLHLPIAENLKAALARVRGKRDITLPEAVALVRSWQVASAYRTFDHIAPKLIEEDDHRRYVIEERLVPLDDSAGVCTMIVRPKAARRLPALLEFSIYADILQRHLPNYDGQPRTAMLLWKGLRAARHAARVRPFPMNMMALMVRR